MPTIGKASIDVDYDGDDLPRQARQIGERAGAAQADAIGEELEKGQKETNQTLGKEAEKAGKDHGTRQGTAYADAQDRILKARTRKLADELAHVFDNEDGVKNFEKSYKGAGDATDNLRGKLEDLRKSNGLTSDQYDTLSGRINSHVRDLEEQRVTEKLLARDIATAHQSARDQLDADDKARVRWADSVDLAYRNVNDSITKNVAESNKRIDEMVDRFNKNATPAVDDFGKAAGRAETPTRNFGDALEDFQRVIPADKDSERLTTTADRVDYLRDKYSKAAPGINGSTPAFQGLLDVLRDLPANDRQKAIAGLGDSIEKFGDAANRGGGKATAGSAGYRDLRRSLGTLEKAGGLGVDVIDGIGDSIATLGESAGRGGDGAGRGAKGFSQLNGPLRILGNFDPFDNPMQLFALIIALAPQVAVLANAAGGGLLILAGGLTALGLAGVGYGIGFSNLFGDLEKLDPQIRPAAKALQGLKDDFANLRLDLQKQIFTPAVVQQFEDFGNKAFVAVDSSFKKIGPSLATVLENISKDLNSSGFKDDLNDLFSGAAPVIVGLGKTASNVFGIIGQLLIDAMPYVQDFVGEVEKATGKFLDFLKTPEGKKSIRDFLDNATRTLKDLGDALVIAGGALVKLVTPKNVERTGEILAAIGDTAAGLIAVAGGLGDINDAFEDLNGGDYGDTVAKEFETIGKGFETFFSNIDGVSQKIAGFFLGVQNQVNTFVGAIKAQFENVGKAFELFGKGDIAGGVAQLGKTFDIGKAAAKDFAQNVAGSFGDTGALFRGLDSTAQTQLGALAGRFDVPKGKAQEFGGDIARLASAAGVDIGRIASAKGWGEIQEITGATGTTIDKLREKYGLLPDVKSTKVSAEGAEQSRKDVEKLDGQIKLLKDKIVTAKEEGASESGGRVQSLRNKIAELEGKKVLVQEEGSNESGNRVDGLKGRITALQGKLVKVLEDGAKPSDQRVLDLDSQIRALQGKTVQVQESGAKPSNTRVDDLHDSINNLQGKLVKVLESGADPSSENVVNLKNKIDDLKGKSVKIAAEGAAGAAGEVGSLIGKISSLQSKTITVTTRFEQSGAIGRGSTQNRFGGIMGGGQQVAGGEKMKNGMLAFARGGLVGAPTMFGNVLAGEAGLEAIVPLTGSLARVDSSVRDLAAYARGMSAPGGGGGRTVQVAPGAVNVYSNSTNGEHIASAVLDRLAIRAGL